MTPPKCRICGMCEHNHRCQGGTPAMRIEERARVRAHAREAAVAADAAEQEVEAAPQKATPRTRWHDDSDAAGEPVEVRTYDRKPARFYAPPGECAYCDRRREAARRSMAAVRERGTDA